MKKREILKMTLLISATLLLTPANVFAEDAQAQIEKGSLGFFEFLKEKEGDPEAADIAIAILTGDTGAFSKLLDSSTSRNWDDFKKHTNLGAENDATSLKNMKASFQFLRECNEYRAAGDTGANSAFTAQSPLMVTSAMMAISQMQLNWSNQEAPAHSVEFNVGENLAWGYDDTYDPFAAWYESERNVYINGEREFYKIGHYQNIIDPSMQYALTGFAVNQDGIAPQAFGQVFFFEAKNLGTAYTVEEYEALFDEYYDQLLAELEEE